jgi:hypothetical protein
MTVTAAVAVVGVGALAAGTDRKVATSAALTGGEVVGTAETVSEVGTDAVASGSGAPSREGVTAS